MSRRILYRALAVVVALAAIAPLFFGADRNGSTTGERQQVQAQVADRMMALGVATPAPLRFQHH